jgi:hypothetical protein
VKSRAVGAAVAASIETARAAPFPTINAALGAIAAWNNATTGSHAVAHNDCGGATVYLMDKAGAAQGYELTTTVTEAAGTCWIDVRLCQHRPRLLLHERFAARGRRLFRLRCDVDKTGATGALSCDDTGQGSSKMLSAMDGTVTLAAAAANPWLISAGFVYQGNINYPSAGG